MTTIALLLLIAVGAAAIYGKNLAAALIALIGFSGLFVYRWLILHDDGVPSDILFVALLATGGFFTARKFLSK